MKPCRDCGKVETRNGGRCPSCRGAYQRSFHAKKRKEQTHYTDSPYKDDLLHKIPCNLSWEQIAYHVQRSSNNGGS